MKWKIVQATAVGVSHNESGQACQDRCVAEALRIAGRHDLLICLLADGAGSAKHGGTGAELACKIARIRIEAALPAINSEKSAHSLVEGWVKAVRLALQQTADAEGQAIREYACTLLGAVIAAKRAIFFQIGDGAIVVTKEATPSVVFWPEAGLYANMTDFVTDADAFQHLQVYVTNDRINELALFSDGLQRLALDFGQHLPYSPFFAPMFTILRAQTTEKCAALDHELAAFLNSEAINTRTDDDKALVLASRLPP